MAYWFYENWTAEYKAVIHEAACGNCNDGHGCHPHPRGNTNGKWHGPYQTLNAVRGAAAATGRPVP
jgi:hypothetical protein